MVLSGLGMSGGLQQLLKLRGGEHALQREDGVKVVVLHHVDQNAQTTRASNPSHAPIQKGNDFTTPARGASI
eukprot:6212677-Pleurochrysis_carterae.AAC.3